MLLLFVTLIVGQMTVFGQQQRQQIIRNTDEEHQQQHESASAADEHAGDLTDAVQIVRTFIAEFYNDTLTGDHENVLEHLNAISAKASSSFKKLAPGLANIVAAGLNSSLPSESPDELKAIGILHTELIEQFEKQDAHINKCKHELVDTYQLDEFDTYALLRIDMLYEMFKDFIDPTINRTKQLKGFVFACKSASYQPIDIIYYIKRKFIANCLKPESREVHASMAEVRKWYQKVETRRTSNIKIATVGGRTFHLLKFRVLNHLTGLTGSEANETAKRIGKVEIPSVVNRRILYNLNSQILSLFKGHQLYEGICLFRSVYEAYNQKRGPVLIMANIVKLSIIKVATMGAMCANVSNNGDAEMMKRDIDEMAQQLGHITQNISTWIRDELEYSWPQCIVNEVEEAMGTTEISDPYAYNVSAQKIWREASARGPVGYVYQVLVFSTKFDSITEFHSICPPENCVFVRNDQLSINYMITRHNASNVAAKAERAKRWFQRVEANLTRSIQQNDKLADLGALAGIMEKAIGGESLTTEYNSYIALHVSTMLARNCVIHTGLSWSEQDGGGRGGYHGPEGAEEEEGYSFLEVYTHHWAPTVNDERFRLFFFL